VRQIEDATVIHVIPKRTVTAGKIAVDQKISYRDEQYGTIFERTVAHIGTKEQCDDMQKILIQRGEGDMRNASSVMRELSTKRVRKPRVNPYLDDADERSMAGPYSSLTRRIKDEPKSPPAKRNKSFTGRDDKGAKKTRKSKEKTVDRKAVIPTLDLDESDESTAGTSPGSPQQIVPKASQHRSSNGHDASLHSSIAKLTKLVESQGKVINYLADNVTSRPYPKSNSTSALQCKRPTLKEVVLSQGEIQPPTQEEGEVASLLLTA
ncbi:hypothetical protein PFISCL1PPCAC_16067, partial [Pristionchus fissidentatus]